MLRLNSSSGGCCFSATFIQIQPMLRLNGLQSISDDLVRNQNSNTTNVKVKLIFYHPITFKF